MKLTTPLLLLALLAATAPANAAGVLTIHAGDMSCEPPQGSARFDTIVLGADSSGTYTLEARGTAIQERITCTFSIVLGPASFLCAPGLATPCGAVTSVAAVPCTVTGPGSCSTTATFTWWRADHGVAFDLPFTLVVNGVPVAQGTFRFCDPPLAPTVVL